MGQKKTGETMVPPVSVRSEEETYFAAATARPANTLTR
jgi:hypothetical protein